MGKNTDVNPDDHKWFDKKWLVILLLVIFFPVGFYALYKNRTFGSPTKWIVAGIFVLLIVLGSLPTTLQQERIAVHTATASSDSTVQSEALQAEEKGNLYSIGDEFMLGNFGYKVLDVEVTKQVGNRYFGKRVTGNASIVIVRYGIVNGSSETQTVMNDDFKIVDQHGRTFSPSSELNTAMSLSSGEDLILTELQPGLAIQMRTAFLVPNSVVENGFTIVIPEKGFFNVGKAKVRVPPK